MVVDVTNKFLNTAKDLDIATNNQVLTYKVNGTDNDLCGFTLQGRSSINLNLEELDSDANGQMIQHTNRNGVLDEGTLRTDSKSTNITLDAGTYYIRVHTNSDSITKYKLSVSASPFDNAENTLNTACDRTINFNGDHYYSFNPSTTRNFNVTLNDLGVHADVQLLNASDQILASFFNIPTTDKSINCTQDQGSYYARVYPSNDSKTDDNQILSATPAINSVTPPSISTSSTIASVNTSSTSAGTRIVQGNLRADTFTYEPGYNLTVISGNGNVDFGSGARKLLDLSQISSTTVSFNLANTITGGVLYNPGNGTRLFDAITLDNGSQILFEDIDTIKFANTTINLSVIPNNPLFNQQWNLQIMGVSDAWRFTTGSNKVLIGIEDTGLGTDSSGKINPDLRPTISVGNNYLDKSSDFSHGTLVEGVIAAPGNNGMGIAGINWNSDVENINVVNSVDYDLASATQAMLNQANSKGQRLVVNLSLTGGDSSAFEQLVANNQNNALFVISSGNENKNSLDSPADLAKKYSNVIAVGASSGTKDYYGNAETPGTRISYSNWWGSNYGDGLTLTAPSEFITTSANYNTKSASFDFGYGGDYGSLFNGTSAAAPNVTGVASLVWSADPNLSATQVRSILSDTAYDLGAPGYDTVYGYGLVNADAAVRRAIALARGAA